MAETISSAALGDAAAAAPSTGWQERVRLLFVGLHDLVQAHPRALPLIGTGVLRTPSGRRWMEELMRALLEAGFTPDAAASVYRSVGAYTLGLGYAQLLSLEIPAQTIVGELTGHWADYPNLLRVGLQLAAWDRPDEFATGLDVLLGHFAAQTGPGRRAMKVKLIAPAKTAADSPFWRSIKYSLFPPLGLATLAGYLDEDDEVTLQDEHVEKLDLTDEPDLVVIEAYVTSARRAYRYADHYRAKGAYVCLGGLHPTSLPEEAAQHADSVFCGPGEDTWPAFLKDFKAGRPQPLYRSTVRTLAGMPRPRRRPHQARALPRAQLARRQPRLPARLRVLLQGDVLPRRQILLRAGGRRRPRRDRPPPRPAPVLPRRQPLRQPAVRRGTV